MKKLLLLGPVGVIQTVMAVGFVVCQVRLPVVNWVGVIAIVFMWLAALMGSAAGYHIGWTDQMKNWNEYELRQHAEIVQEVNSRLRRRNNNDGAGP